MDNNKKLGLGNTLEKMKRKTLIFKGIKDDGNGIYGKRIFFDFESLSRFLNSGNSYKNTSLYQMNKLTDTDDVYKYQELKSLDLEEHHSYWEYFNE